MQKKRLVAKGYGAGQTKHGAQAGQILKLNDYCQNVFLVGKSRQIYNFFYL